jgi:methyl-accepting chemotaxis protein
MSGLLTVPRAALLLAGVAAATLSRAFKTSDAEQIEQLKKTLADLQSRHESRLQQLEVTVADHAQRLNEVPSTAQIVAAMEALLSKTMTSLDERLSAQAHSIEVLKTTVSQTDELLERVLESIDNLRQPENEPTLVG